MKFLTKLRNAISRKKTFTALSALTLIVAIPVAVNAGFFPNRATFDYNKYSGNNNCADTSNIARDHGRCGSLDGPVFDSFVNVPNIGDERNFLDGYRSDQTAPGTHADPVTNVTDGAQEVTMRLYIHNNANAGTNASGQGVAHDTSVRFALPNAQNNAQRAVGYISASNAAPQVVEDSIDMTSTKNFTVQYEPGSAKLYNNGPFKNGVALSDSVVTSGTKVGYSSLNGEFPGCFDYIATVEIKVKIIPKEVPNLNLVKQVRMTGSKTWGSEVAAKPGDDVQWLLNTKNTGMAALNTVVTRDVLPPHVKLDTGSVQFIDAHGTQTLADGPLFAGGYNAGRYDPGDNTLITFKTKVLDDFEGCSVRVRNVAHAKSYQTPNEITDDADVVITKENCSPPKTPAYSCDMLDVIMGENRTATFKAQAFATNGATISGYRYNFGDNTPELLSSSATVSHTYAQPGQYAAHVTVLVSVNGETKAVTSDKCAAAVTFTTTPGQPGTPTTPTTPGQPTTLVNTGAGSVIGMFAAATAAGFAIYRRLLSRQLG